MKKYSIIKRPGQKYSLSVKGQEKSTFEYFDARLAKWLPGDRNSSLLDLGCGQGKFLGYLHLRGYTNITGVDISPEQVNLARSAVQDARIHEMDMLDFLAGKNNCYDCISALDVIEHLEKDRVLHFLEAVFNALNPGGRLILQTPNAASPWGMSLRYGDFSHGCCFTPSNLRQLLALTGFKEIYLQDTAPIPKRPARYILWKIFSLYFKLYNLVEMGTIGDGIYTRVFQCCALKASDSRRSQVPCDGS
jgi:2-polyprenyl-3-methyl-5-hydroxy-6-metoxy-1,4-benzoquinol methylase